MLVGGGRFLDLFGWFSGRAHLTKAELSALLEHRS